MKAFVVLFVLVMALSASAAPPSSTFSYSERLFLQGSFQKLLPVGFSIDESYLRPIGSETEFEIMFANDPDKEQARQAVVFARPGKTLIYVNTWKAMWSNLTDRRLLDRPDLLQSSQVVIASLLRFSLETATGGPGGYGTADPLPAHKAELALLERYAKEGVGNLEVPIKETKKEIERLKRLKPRT